MLHTHLRPRVLELDSGINLPWHCGFTLTHCLEHALHAILTSNAYPRHSWRRLSGTESTGTGQCRGAPSVDNHSCLVPRTGYVLRRAYDAEMSGVPQGPAVCLLDWVPVSSSPNSLPAVHAYKPLSHAKEFASVNVRKMKLVAAKRGAPANTHKTYDSGVEVEFEVRALLSSQSEERLDTSCFG